MTCGSKVMAANEEPAGLELDPRRSIMEEISKDLQMMLLLYYPEGISILKVPSQFRSTFSRSLCVFDFTSLKEMLLSTHIRKRVRLCSSDGKTMVYGRTLKEPLKNFFARDPVVDSDDDESIVGPEPAEVPNKSKPATRSSTLESIQKPIAEADSKSTCNAQYRTPEPAEESEAAPMTHDAQYCIPEHKAEHKSKPRTRRGQQCISETKAQPSIVQSATLAQLLTPETKPRAPRGRPWKSLINKKNAERTKWENANYGSKYDDIDNLEFEEEVFLAKDNTFKIISRQEARITGNYARYCAKRYKVSA